jgi:hypothetical protein
MSKQKYPQASVSTSDTGKKTSRVSKVRAEYSSFHLHAKRKRKKEEAEERQAAYDKLTTKQKLEQLGPTGSNRQRKRLETILAATVPGVPPITTVAPKAVKVKKPKS